MDYRQACVMVVGITVLVACGGSGGQATASPSPTTAPVVTSSAAAPAAPVSPSPKPAGAKDACALVSQADMESALGTLKPGTVPTLEAGTTAAGPPGMLDAANCSYRFPSGDISVVLAHFQDSASASAGFGQLLAMIASQSSNPLNPSPVTGLGDEAQIFAITLPPPTPGRGAGLLVRKGSVDFAFFGGFAEGSGPPDLGQAFKTLATKVAGTL